MCYGFYVGSMSESGGVIRLFGYFCLDLEVRRLFGVDFERFGIFFVGSAWLCGF